MVADPKILVQSKCKLVPNQQRREEWRWRGILPQNLKPSCWFCEHGTAENLLKVSQKIYQKYDQIPYLPLRLPPNQVLCRSSISSKSHGIHNTSSAMAVSGAPMPDRFLRADGKALAKEAPPAPGAPKLKVDAGFGVAFGVIFGKEGWWL